MIKITGLDEFSRKLDELAKNAEDLGNTSSVPMSELFSDAFISKHTRFSSLSEMFEAGGFKAATNEEFEQIPKRELSAFVRCESPFESWEEMLAKAGEDWAVRKLGL